MNILLIIYFLIIPGVILILNQKFNFIRAIGPVILCYIAGIAVGNTNFIPQGFINTQTTLSELTIAFSLPLLLFSIDVKQWLRLARKAMLGMLLAIISIVVFVSIAHLIFIKYNSKEAWQMAGMAIGLYTGGTPNLAAIKSALHISNDTYILFHTYDTLFSFIYIIFVSSIAQPLFNKILIPYKKSNNTQINIDFISSDQESVKSAQDENHIQTNRINLLKLLAAFLLAIATAGSAAGISSLFPKGASGAIAILLITTFGIALSFIKQIRIIPKTFELGMYIIYIFCVVVGSMTDLNKLITINYYIFFYVGSAVFISMTFHAFLCKIFKVDTDTFLITSTAAICSPPFVPVIAGALKNKEIILSGLTTGIIGYAIGNYLGISIAFLLKWF